LQINSRASARDKINIRKGGGGSILYSDLSHCVTHEDEKRKIGNEMKNNGNNKKITGNNLRNKWELNENN
jgi:hypothetical protein